MKTLLMTALLLASFSTFANSESLGLEDCAKGNQDKRSVVKKDEKKEEVQKETSVIDG
jgi:hypothetical protein